MSVAKQREELFDLKQTLLRDRMDNRYYWRGLILLGLLGSVLVSLASFFLVRGWSTAGGFILLFGLGVCAGTACWGYTQFPLLTSSTTMALLRNRIKRAAAELSIAEAAEQEQSIQNAIANFNPPTPRKEMP